MDSIKVTKTNLDAYQLNYCLELAKNLEYVANLIMT